MTIDKLILELGKYLDDHGNAGGEAYIKTPDGKLHPIKAVQPTENNGAVLAGSNEPKAKPPELNGIPRQEIMLTAGFLKGLAYADRFHFERHERKLLETGGMALFEVGKSMYTPEELER